MGTVVPADRLHDRQKRKMNARGNKNSIEGVALRVKKVSHGGGGTGIEQFSGRK